MKKFFSSLMVAAIVCGGSVLMAEGPGDAQAKAAKEQMRCDKAMEMVKKVDPAKYEEISKLGDTKAKLAACKEFMTDKQLQNIKSVNEAKYNELMSLKQSDPKAFQKALIQYTKEMHAAKKAAQKPAKKKE